MDKFLTDLEKRGIGRIHSKLRGAELDILEGADKLASYVSPSFAGCLWVILSIYQKLHTVRQDVPVEPELYLVILTDLNKSPL